MLVKFYPLMFDCSCVKSSKTVSDECLLTCLDPPVKYRTRGIWRGGFISRSVKKRHSVARVLGFCSPTCPHRRVFIQAHTSTQTHISHSHTSLPNAHISFPLLFLSCGRSLTHTHVRAHTHTHTDTHRHTIPMVSLSRDLVKARGHGRPELC